MGKQKRSSGPERRRHLVDINLLSESKPGPARPARGCFHLFGIFIGLMGIYTITLLSLR